MLSFSASSALIIRAEKSISLALEIPTVATSLFISENGYMMPNLAGVTAR